MTYIATDKAAGSDPNAASFPAVRGLFAVGEKTKTKPIVKIAGVDLYQFSDGG